MVCAGTRSILAKAMVGCGRRHTGLVIATRASDVRKGETDPMNRLATLVPPRLLVPLIALAVVSGACTESTEVTSSPPEPAATSQLGASDRATPPDAPVAEATAAPTDLPAAEPIPHLPIDEGQAAGIILKAPQQTDVDAAITELEAMKKDGQIVIRAEFGGCSLREARAIPHPNHVLVRAIWEPVDCTVGFSFEAFFIVETIGVNNHGPWAYTQPPPVEIEFTSTS